MKLYQNFYIHLHAFELYLRINLTIFIFIQLIYYSFDHLSSNNGAHIHKI